jgi:homoserine kinase
MTPWRSDPAPFKLRVPASSANLGPGFDSIGLALGCYLRATVRPAPSFSIRFASTRWAPTNPSFEAEIVRGVHAAAGTQTVPPVAIEVENDIPLGKGMGASAAGAVLGLCIARELLAAGPDEAEMARLACRLEGHPDNALPALIGGIVVAAQNADGTPAYLRFLAPPSLRAAVVVPQIVLPTAAARALLPERYERRDVVFNLQRAALLAAALACDRLDVLRTATADRVHQPYRAPLVPGFADMLALDLPGLLAVALSGAGPSVLAMVDGNADGIAAAMRDCFAREGVQSDAFILDVAARGAEVEPFPRSNASV